MDTVDYESKKESIIKELAKLERLNWSADEKVADSVFPYVLVEAINILKNSKINSEFVEYTKTSEDTNKLLDEILAD
jgi:hypothetical protein